MYQDVLRSIDGVSLFPVIAILIFVAFFTLIFIYVIRMDKKKVEQLAEIPLKDEFIPSVSNMNAQTDRS